MRWSIILLSIVLTASVHARIWERPLQFADRYGSPRTDAASKGTNERHPVLEGAIHRTYVFQGWTIRAAFLELDGPAVRMEYQKKPTAGASLYIQDYELEAIASANALAGSKWKAIFYDAESSNKGVNRAAEVFFMDAVGAKMWERSDDARLSLRPGKTAVHAELPGARQHEQQLKARREQKARASVPQF